MNNDGQIFGYHLCLCPRDLTWFIVSFDGGFAYIWIIYDYLKGVYYDRAHES